MFFAVIAVGLLGFVSLATEVGTWYLTRSAADNAADASAIAGALAISNGASTSDAQAAATDTATDNGYTTSGAVTVTANILPATGSNTNSPAEVLINVTVTPILASLFGSGTPTIASRSVAIVNPGNPACVLSTIGDLVITQNQGSFNAYNCTYASNASDSTAVNITGGATITAYGVTSMGSCTGCPRSAPGAACRVVSAPNHQSIRHAGDRARHAGVADAVAKFGGNNPGRNLPPIRAVADRFGSLRHGADNGERDIQLELILLDDRPTILRL